MPELPEVETTRRGIAPHITGRIITDIVVRESRLRWPVPADLAVILQDQVIRQVERRAKYLLLHIDSGCMLLHLGMSGSLRILSIDHPVRKHDHIDIRLNSGYCLRFNDPRRFGSLLWTSKPSEQHRLLRNLGPEPLSSAFSGDYLYALSKDRKTPVKSFIMDGRIVVGVGNIYANEALFMAGISPKRAAGRIALARYQALALAICEVLSLAIAQGGTTLRDFVGSQGEPGYFAQQLRVYGRYRLPCCRCGQPIQQCRLGQRASYYCPHCQH